MHPPLCLIDHRLKICPSSCWSYEVFWHSCDINADVPQSLWGEGGNSLSTCTFVWLGPRVPMKSLCFPPGLGPSKRHLTLVLAKEGMGFSAALSFQLHQEYWCQEVRGPRFNPCSDSWDQKLVAMMWWLRLCCRVGGYRSTCRSFLVLPYSVMYNALQLGFWFTWVSCKLWWDLVLWPFKKGGLCRKERISYWSQWEFCLMVIIHASTGSNHCLLLQSCRLLFSLLQRSSFSLPRHLSEQQRSFPKPCHWLLPQAVLSRRYVVSLKSDLCARDTV